MLGELIDVPNYIMASLYPMLWKLENASRVES